MIEEIKRRMGQGIKDFGWWIQAVLPGPDNPPFAYTVGMTETFGHPEFLMIGFRPEMMHQLLNGCGRLVKDGERFGNWSMSEKVIEGFPVWFREVAQPEAGEWAKAVRGRYDSFQVLQVFLPDAEGRFPWDLGCNPQYVQHQGVLLPHLVSAKPS